MLDGLVGQAELAIERTRRTAGHQVMVAARLGLLASRSVQRGAHRLRRLGAELAGCGCDSAEPLSCVRQLRFPSGCGCSCHGGRS